MQIRNYYLWRDFSTFLPIGTHIPFVADDGVTQFDRFFYGGGIQFNFSTELFGRPNRIVTGVDIDIQKDDRQRFLNDAGVQGAMSFDQIEEAETYGVFVRDELSITDSLIAVVGRPPECQCPRGQVFALGGIMLSASDSRLSVRLTGVRSVRYQVEPNEIP